MILLFASLLAALPGVQSASVASPASADVPILQRIVVLGASVSDGFGLEPEVGARVGLADVVEASLRCGHRPVEQRTSLLFFIDPEPRASGLVAAAKLLDPTLVVGIDYLFWFGYGIFPSEGHRLAMLDKGLASLEAFSCTLMIGDLPDMSAAAGGASPEKKGGLLSREQVPSRDTLVKLNERVRAWARGRENVVVVPVAELLARLHAGLEIVIRGNTWAPGALDRILQKDRLHPTLEGTIALWLAGLDALADSREDAPASAFDWDARSIQDRVYRSREKERAAKLERAREKVPRAR